MPLDGRKVSRTSFPDFYIWAVNSGLNNVALKIDNNGVTLPDIRGRFLVGKSDSIGLGSSGGEATHTLTINEMPAHAHPVNIYAGNPGNLSGGFVNYVNTAHGS